MSPSPAAAIARSPVGSVDACLTKGAGSQKMSLNAMLQNESFEQIRLEAGDLARLARQFPGYSDILSNPIADGDMAGVLRLSGSIVTSLDKIVRLRNQLEHAACKTMPHAAEPARASRMKQKRLSLHACHNCETTNTPKWRAGPHGPHSLCNVCGLLNAKRAARHLLRHPPKPLST
ncbi:hypothetical protein XA68_11574 [Ophiocordyceps unilateralis]|uniref:GATA-type domain-containing protein n=1 Tax=Ophiocordyceps unilateralis TaxID=268505 RepID=A0A2A9PG47_OPHUN|nr:hypothetical protein XA68_11574 [Ophiocordyceps unilateralis]